MNVFLIFFFFPSLSPSLSLACICLFIDDEINKLITHQLGRGNLRSLIVAFANSESLIKGFASVGVASV